MSKKVAFIGLGVMGFPMAGYLSQAGHEVCVYNRTSTKSNAWLEQYAGRAAVTVAEAVTDAEFVFSCVGNDDDLREITVGDKGAFVSMKEGTLFIDHTTVSASVTRELAEVARGRGLGYLDAPVSGGQQGAEKGQLTVMVGGNADEFQRAASLIDSYARQVTLLGPVGSGQLCKMVNQICVAGLIEALAEGLHFARAAGLDADQVIDVISKGAAQSWQMDNRYQTMLAGEYNHGFAVDLMRKDLGIVLAEAKKNGSQLPVTKLVNEFYDELHDMGGGRWDTSSLLARLEKIGIK
ncbi:MAG: NAD(P)-dependent oxidoreductase [Gammaproteobacteria bacterium]|nr:MAG: NAD(P)-dependent oxidoreductase [Gammaproteobacteria bacterium]